jgi:hypothetical protein
MIIITWDELSHKLRSREVKHSQTILVGIDGRRIPQPPCALPPISPIAARQVCMSFAPSIRPHQSRRWRGRSQPT